MYKFLKIVIVLLLLVTIGEAGYYLYYYINQRQLATSKTAVTSNVALITSPIPACQIQENINLCQTVSLFKPTDFQKVKLVIEKTGIIKNLLLNKTSDPKNNCYFKFKLVKDNGDSIGDHCYVKAAFDKEFVKVYKINKNGTKERITENQLRENDKIQYVTTREIKDKNGTFADNEAYEIILLP